MSATDTSTTESESVIDLAIASVGTEQLDPNDPGVIGVVLPQNATYQVLDLSKYADRPRRAAGTTAVHDAESFATIYERHATADGSVIYADTPNHSIVGVFNDNEPNQAGRGDHRVTFNPILTDAWKAWIEKDNKLFTQQAFAEFIENNAADIVNPSAATMLELAQTFQAKTGLEFEQGSQLHSGERTFVYKETVGATAGATGHLTIPTEIELGLRPFEGADAYKVLARFRYRITDEGLKLAYKLDRPEDVVREAFKDVLDDVEAKTRVPSIKGTPPR